MKKKVGRNVFLARERKVSNLIYVFVILFIFISFSIFINNHGEQHKMLTSEPLQTVLLIF